MAAVAVPLISALLPEVINLIAGLVHKAAPVAEVSNGPKTGPVKFADVFAAVMTALQNAAAAGSIPKILPPDDTVKAIIQAVVTSMQISGVLGTPATPAAPSAYTVKAGQTITITGAP